MVVAVYGSLKKNCFNHTAFGFNQSKYIKTIRVPGYELYDVGYIPVAVATKDTSKSIVAELYDVPSDIYIAVKRMELGAGYSEVELHIGGYRAVMWVYDSIPKYGTLIPNGEWVEKPVSIDNFEHTFDTGEGTDDVYIDDTTYQKLIREIPELKNLLSDGTIDDADDLDEYIYQLSNGRYIGFDDFVTQMGYLTDDDEDDWLKSKDDDDADEWIKAIDRDIRPNKAVPQQTTKSWGGSPHTYNVPVGVPTVADPTVPCECPNEIGGHWVYDDTIEKWVCMGCGEVQDGIKI